MRSGDESVDGGLGEEGVGGHGEPFGGLAVGDPDGALPAVAFDDELAIHFVLTISDGQFTFTRDEANIDREAGLDGIYIIRTSVPEAAMDAGTVVNTDQSLARVERDFRSIKSIDLDLRPSTTGLQTASAHTCSSACSPPTSSGICAKPGPR